MFQTIDVQYKDLNFMQFSMNAFLSAYGAEGWGVAAVVISYLDKDEKRLGDTKYFTFSSLVCPYTLDSITWLHQENQKAHQVSDTVWHTYAYNIMDEIQEIGIGNPAEVCKIKITAIDTCGAYG